MKNFGVHHRVTFCGAYLSIYPTKNIGAAAYIVIDDTIEGPKILLTIQKRIIDKKPELVAEPPMGFFNDSPPPNSSVTPAEQEFIERESYQLFKESENIQLVNDKRPEIIKKQEI